MRNRLIELLRDAPRTNVVYSEEEGFIDMELDEVLDGVSHWMPMPEPPQKKGE